MKTLSANVTTGIAGKSTPVLLVKLTNGTTEFRWSQMATTKFGSGFWTGDDFLAGIIRKNGIGDIQQGVDVPAGKSVSSLGSVDIKLNNQKYSGSDRLDQHLETNGIVLQGFKAEIRLIFNLTGASWANGAEIFKGDMEAPEFDLGTFILKIRDRTPERYPTVPQKIISAATYPNVDAAGGGNPDVLSQRVPMVYGEVSVSPAYLVDATAGAQEIVTDTEKWDELVVGDLIADATISGLTVYRYALTVDNAGTDDVLYKFNSIVEGSAENNSRCPLEWAIDVNPTGDSSYGTVHDFEADPGNVYDDDEATYASYSNNSSSGTQGKRFLGEDVSNYPNYDALKLEDFISKFYGFRVRFKVTDVGVATDLSDFDLYVYLSTGIVPVFDYDKASNQSTIEMFDNESGYDAGAGGASTIYEGYFTKNSHGTTLPAYDDLENTGATDGIIFTSTGNTDSAYDDNYRIYEIYYDSLLSEPMNEVAFWVTNLRGREYGSSSGFISGTRYDSAAVGDMISAPPAVVESLLRYEMGETTEINTGAFDDAYTAGKDWGYSASLFYGGCVQEWPIAKTSFDEEGLLDTIAELCESTGSVFVEGYDSSFKFHFVEIASTPDRTLATGALKKGAIGRRIGARKRDIRNKFILKYDYNARTQRFEKTLEISQSMGLYSGQDFYYLQSACANSVSKFSPVDGKEQILEIESKWVKTEASAYKLGDWLVWRWCEGLELLDVVSKGLADVDLEAMDTLRIKHPLTEAVTGLDYLLYKSIFSPVNMTTTQKLFRRPIELSRYNGAPSLMQGRSANAIGLWGVRRMKDAYTGDIMQVRRDSDDALQDIGFDIDGNLDIAALETFCGSDDGFVVKLYDQSGNGNTFAQATNTDQPVIVDKGDTVLGSNNRPTIRFGDPYGHLLCPAPTYSDNGALGIVVVAKEDSTDSSQTFLSQNDTFYGDTSFWFYSSYDRLRMRIFETGAYPYGNEKDYRTGVANHGERWIYSQILFDADVLTMFTDGVEDTPYQKLIDDTMTTFFNSPVKDLAMGANINKGSDRYRLDAGFISEMALFNSNITTDDREAMENSIAAYYNL